MTAPRVAPVRQHVPLVDLAPTLHEVADEIRAGLGEVFAATAFIGGRAVTEFEQAYAAFVGASHCVGVANGTDAVELSLRAVGVRPGGEVIVPANTFVATAEAAARIGAAIVPVDVDPHYLLIDPRRIADAISERTQAIVPVHLFGQMADMERIRAVADASGVPVIEDAAQSQGATRNGTASGAAGSIAATSFYPGKNLGAAGDAGGVTTDDPLLARAVRLMGQHGSEHKYVHEVLGWNSRLDAIQAVVLSAKLERLRSWNEQRRAAATRYDELLGELTGVTLPQTAPGNEHVWHLYVIQVDDRDRILRELNEAGIGAGIHYPVPIHLTPAFASLGALRGGFPVAERAANRILSLPIHPHITPQQQEYVVAVLAAALGG